ncbi:MAG: hypothetical protein J6V99_07630 [Neisseriaceae bacterium]|nr:hypothetical protein [Neisseriaceae bacterium]
MDYIRQQQALGNDPYSYEYVMVVYDQDGREVGRSESLSKTFEGGGAIRLNNMTPHGIEVDGINRSHTSTWNTQILNASTNEVVRDFLEESYTVPHNLRTSISVKTLMLDDGSPTFMVEGHATDHNNEKGEWFRTDDFQYGTINVVVWDEEGHTIRDLYTSTDANGNWIIDSIPGSFEDGKYAIKATAFDNLGNESPIKVKWVTVNVRIDEPEVLVGELGDADVTPDDADDIIEMTVTYTDEEGQEQTIVLAKEKGDEYYDEENDIWTADNHWYVTEGELSDTMSLDESTGRLHFDASDLQDGSTVTATNKDTADNVASASGEVAYEPASNPTSITNATRAEDRFSYNLTGTGEPNSTVKFHYIDVCGRPQDVVTTVDEEGNWTAFLDNWDEIATANKGYMETTSALTGRVTQTPLFGATSVDATINSDVGLLFKDSQWGIVPVVSALRHQGHGKDADKAILSSDGDDILIVGVGNAAVTGAVSETANIDMGDGNDQLLVVGEGYINNNAVVNMGAGDDHLTTNSNIDKASVQLGDGDDALTVGGYINNNSIIDAGSGDDVLSVNTYIDRGTIHLGDGYDSLTIGGYVTNRSVITGGEGGKNITTGNIDTSTINIESVHGNHNLLSTGYVTTSNIDLHTWTGLTTVAIGYSQEEFNSNITSMDELWDLGSGHGNVVSSTIHTSGETSTILISGYVTGSSAQILSDSSVSLVHIGSNLTAGTISLGIEKASGSAYVHIGGYVSGAPATINVTNGDDVIQIGSNVDGATIKTNDGDDTLEIGGYVTGFAEMIDMGAGDDVVTIGKDLMNKATVLLGEGDDQISVGGPKLSGLIDGGEGHDVLTLTGKTNVGVHTQNDHVNNVELINLNGSASTANLDGYYWAHQVIDGNTSSLLMINGDSNDTVDLGANGSKYNMNGSFADNEKLIKSKRLFWNAGEDTEIDGVNYHAYSYTDSGVTVTALIQDGINII